MVVFIAGQVVITVGTGEGKWAGCMVMLVFCTNSALNPILLLLCSKTIRCVHMIGIKVKEKCENINRKNEKKNGASKYP